LKNPLLPSYLWKSWLLIVWLAAVPVWAALPDPVALGVALEMGNVDAARRWLDEGLDPNKEADRIGTGLMIGAWEGNLAMMELFLSRGADIHKVNRHGEQALQLAAWRGRTEAVRWLLDRGATVNRGGKAWSALHYRVKTIVQISAPKKPPPKKAALALAAVSIAAVAGAVFVRAHDVLRPQEATPEPDRITAQIETPTPADGVGGPLHAVEPLSENYLYAVDPAPRMTIVSVNSSPLDELSVPDLAPDSTLREPTFLERLADFHPLRRDDESTAQTDPPKR